MELLFTKISSIESEGAESATTAESAISRRYRHCDTMPGDRSESIDKSKSYNKQDFTEKRRKSDLGEQQVAHRCGRADRGS